MLRVLLAWGIIWWEVVLPRTEAANSFGIEFSQAIVHIKLSIFGQMLAVIWWFVLSFLDKSKWEGNCGDYYGSSFPNLQIDGWKT